MMRTRLFSAAALLALLAALNSCGGSDSSYVAPPATPTTGVASVGVITGFGSVYLNGVRYDMSGAQVMVNGAAATESDLKVGQFIQLKGHAHDAGYYADVVRYHHIIEGPISSIDIAASSFVAMGQTVFVTSSTTLGDGIVPASIEGLKVGAVVEVSGLVASTGVIEATRVDLMASGGSYDVTGYVSNLDAAKLRFNVNALAVDYSTATLDGFATGAPSNGDLVLVKGDTFNADGSFVAFRVELRSNDWLTPGVGDQLEVEGAITDFVSATDFKVSGWPVTTTASTVYEHGTVANLANDVKVEVEGAANAQGVLVANKVMFKEVNTIRIVAQIETLTAATGSLQLLRLAVATDQTTRFEDQSAHALRTINFADLAIGDWVDVRGYEDPAGSNAVTATRVVRIEAQNSVRMRGPFQEAAQPSFRILSVPVATDASATRFVLEDGGQLTQAAFFAQAPGQLVEAWGSWDGTTLTAAKAEIKVLDD